MYMNIISQPIIVKSLITKLQHISINKKKTICIDSLWCFLWVWNWYLYFVPLQAKEHDTTLARSSINESMSPIHLIIMCEYSISMTLIIRIPHLLILMVQSNSTSLLLLMVCVLPAFSHRFHWSKFLTIIDEKKRKFSVNQWKIRGNLQSSTTCIIVKMPLTFEKVWLACTKITKTPMPQKN